MNYQITHTTTYDYRDAVSVSHHILRLSPREGRHQRCLKHAIQINPTPAVSRPHHEYFGNAVFFVTVEGAHRRLEVKAVSRVTVTRPPLPMPVETPAWESVREFSRGHQIGPSLEACEFVFNSPQVTAKEAYGDYAHESFSK